MRVHPSEHNNCINTERCTDEEENEVEYTRKSLGFIPIESKFRRKCIQLVSDSRFETFILVMIVLNAISMATIDYRFIDENYQPDPTKSARNHVFEITEIFFAVVFILECLVKIFALGLFRGQNAYLRNSLNIFDFVIVVLSVISVIPIVPNLSALRSFRVLRPLRSLVKLPGLRKIVGALVESYKDLSNVMLLLGFLIFGFSLTGMMFWKGLLHARCRLTPYPIKMPENCTDVNDICWSEYLNKVIVNPEGYRCSSFDNDDPSWTQRTSPWFQYGPKNCIWPIDDVDERICSLSGKGNHHCLYLDQSTHTLQERTCGSNYDRFGNPRFIDSQIPFGYPRMRSGTFIESLNYGFTNYDTFISAFLTSFQVITLEGWTDLLYQIMDAWMVTPAIVIFALQVVICGYIVLNIVLAVITKSLDEILDQEDLNDEQSWGNSQHFSNMLDSQENSSPPEQRLKKIDYHSIFIMACIVLNTIVLSLDHYGINDEHAQLLETFNTCFTVIFICDVILCNIVYGPRAYWSDGFRCFDGIIGGISLFELVFIIISDASSGSSAFSVLRSLRLFRIFKMAKNWKSLQSLLKTIASTISEIWNFAALLFLFMFIYSLIGMQILSNRLRFSNVSNIALTLSDEGYEEAYVPRANFDSFYWAMVTIFQILTGENWNTIMYDCWKARGMVATFYIMSLIIIGDFIVMNLFLAILLKNFEENGDLVDGQKLELALESREDSQTKKRDMKRPSKIQLLWAKIGKDNRFRKICLKIVEKKWFDVVITVLIMISSVLLALDNPLMDPSSFFIKALRVCDCIFTMVFVGEAIVKILAYGLCFESKAYFRSAWNVLDFFIVIISVLSLAKVWSGSALKALRTLRVLRPLRMVNKFPELKVVVDALLLSFPSVANVGVLCGLFFLIFASFAVNFLKGTFYHCSGSMFDHLSEEQLDFLVNPTHWGDVPQQFRELFLSNIEGCNVNAWSDDTIPTSMEVCNCLAPGEWKLMIPQNFDNIISGIATLFEISTTEGWTDVMFAAVDQRGIEMQPRQNSNPLWAIFFISFLIFGSFFVLELFVGVTIDNFNKIRTSTGRTLMTEGQKNWARTQQFIMKIRPLRKLDRPEKSFRAKCFDFVMPHSNQYFEPFISACIIGSALNTAMASFGDSYEKQLIISSLNYTFAIIFTIEIVLKLIALSARFFDDRWNTFDLLIVCGTDFGLVINIFISSASSVVGVIRLARICRLFRLVRNLKKLRTLFNTLIMSVPSIANIGILMLLLFFMYAIVGVQSFSFLPNNEEIDDHANFRSFGNAMLLLLRFSTGENWNGFMRSMMENQPNCSDSPIYDSPWCISEADLPECRQVNGCGAGLFGFIYFYSFTLLMSYVVMNLFVGIVLEAFESSNEGDILKAEDLAAFTAAWSRFDPEATWFIEAKEMKTLLMILEPPLGLGVKDFHSTDKILDDPCLKGLRVNKDGKVHIVEAATALAKRLTIQKGEIDLETTDTESGRTLDDVFNERMIKKRRVIRAIVNLARATAIASSSVGTKDTEKIQIENK